MSPEWSHEYNADTGCDTNLVTSGIMCFCCLCFCPESGHTIDNQSSLESVYGGLTALLASEETQQDDDPQSLEDENSGGKGVSSG